MSERESPEPSDPSAVRPTGEHGEPAAGTAVTRLRSLEEAYDDAARVAQDAESHRATLEREVVRARKAAAMIVAGGARGATVTEPLDALPASGVRVVGRTLEWRAAAGAAGTATLDLGEVESISLGQRAKLRHTLTASALFASSLLVLVGSPLRWPRLGVLVGGFAGFFVLAASGAALVLHGVRFHLVVRARGKTVRIPLAAEDVVTVHGRPCNADRLLAAARDAKAALSGPRSAG